MTDKDISIAVKLYHQTEISKKQLDIKSFLVILSITKIKDVLAICHLNISCSIVPCIICILDRKPIIL
jgi:hypothetical protein